MFWLCFGYVLVEFGLVGFGLVGLGWVWVWVWVWVGFGFGSVWSVWVVLGCVRGVSWSEVATVPKRKSHRGLDLDLSLNSELNIWKGWKENSGMK